MVSIRVPLHHSAVHLFYSLIFLVLSVVEHQAPLSQSTSDGGARGACLVPRRARKKIPVPCHATFWKNVARGVPCHVQNSRSRATPCHVFRETWHGMARGVPCVARGTPDFVNDLKHLANLSPCFLQYNFLSFKDL